MSQSVAGDGAQPRRGRQQPVAHAGKDHPVIRFSPPGKRRSTYTHLSKSGRRRRRGERESQ
ncbi:hypothetical protein M419DRAFT_118087 [Trichoderma reesei RUT C-30]|uniref:Uncharacterized protein n=1 Tax=Hypocrea jecorina (strain ATCC 56765 / BCRC 32924 / NRRL 11460 / Rut C-30) TaxID=1344414 RepID=A0A024SHK4_HYPJR|nr:hypothetical protein M419DRAFT_118087 [Trichoderma reesei RUT C-30]